MESKTKPVLRKIGTRFAFLQAVCPAASGIVVLSLCVADRPVKVASEAEPLVWIILLLVQGMVIVEFSRWYVHAVDEPSAVSSRPGNYHVLKIETFFRLCPRQADHTGDSDLRVPMLRQGTGSGFY